MPSSTSNSKPRFRLRYAKALLLLLFGLACIELIARTVLVNASKDLRRFRGYASRAAALTAQPQPQLAFIGNSATDDGVDLELFTNAYSTPQGGTVYADKFVADASRINTWHHVMKHAFFDQGIKPSTFVVTFYEDDLLDGNQVETGRLAHFFTSVSDWPSVFATDVQDFESRVDFMLSSFSAAIAVRARVKERVLSLLVPNFKSFLQDVNTTNHAMTASLTRQRPVEKAIQTTAALERLLGLAKAHDAKLAFVAYPLPTAFDNVVYELDPRVPVLLSKSGAVLIDARDPSQWGLRPHHYKDDVHLTAEGARLWSQALAKLLILQANH